MPRVVTYLKKSTIEKLNTLCELEDLSISNVAAEMIEIGLKVKENSLDKTKGNKDSISDKTPEYLLRILNICSEVFKNTYADNSKMVHDTESREALDGIKAKVDLYLEKIHS